MKNILAALLFCAAFISQIKAENISELLLKETSWRAYYNTGKVKFNKLAKSIGNEPGLEIKLSKSAKKQTYAAIIHNFPEKQNWSGVKNISFFAKTSHRIFFKINIACEGGCYDTGWLKKGTTSTFNKFSIAIAKMKKQGKPDLAKVKNISFGFGMWAMDTSKENASIIITKLKTVDTSAAYIIPRPSEGVCIDGAYRDDWGYEDNLYNWTPPDYLFLNDKSQLVPGRDNWKSIEQLSGRFAFMMDDKNLYFLGLVVDKTPFQGKNPSSIWENDSVELFLAPGVTNRHISYGLNIGEAKGIQVIFNCGEKQNNLMVLCRRKEVEKSGVEYKVTPQSWLLNGKQCKGYILEASIPLKVFPDFKRKRGMLIGYSIKLNDYSGPSLIITPDNLKPNANIKNFKKAYIELKLDENASKIKFGAPAKDVFWPEKYTKDAGKLKIWDMSKAFRKKASATTERLYLNSLWAVQGVADSSNPPKAGEWSYMPLPLGIGWYTPVFQIDKKNNDILNPREIGYGKLGGRKKPFFWYERLFTPDASFKGKNVSLTVEYVVKELNVYLNKEFIGTISPANPSINITDKLKYGKENRLDFMLYTNIIPGISVANGWSGIMGDIYLEAHNHKPLINDLWIRKASGIDGSFDIQAETKPSDKKLTLKLQILDKAGKVLASSKSEVPPAPKISVSNLTGKCGKFAPWSPEKPNLFFARLQVFENGKLIDESKKRFGFRTLIVQNGRFLLNGKILRLRVGFDANPSRTPEPGRLKMLKKYGYNAVFKHASNSGHNGPLFDRLDEEGLLAFAPTNKSWNDKMTIQEIRRYRSHPSVIGYVSDSFGQLDVNGFIHNPFCTSDTYYPNSSSAVRLYKYLRKRNDLFKSVDPTRPYIPQGTGNFEGAFKNIHHYPCYDVNLLDRMMYFEPWSKRRNPLHPLHLYEGTLVSLVTVDSAHPEHKFQAANGRMVNRLLVYEDAAKYIGTKAFDGWLEWDRLIAKYTLRGFRTCGLDGFTPWISDDIFLNPCNTKGKPNIKDNRKLSYKYFMQPFDSNNFENTWMRLSSWYYRLRGMARWQWPEQFGQGELQEKRSIFTGMYENEMQPLFAYIGGRKGEVFSLGHNYFAGEQINKQIVVANDTENDFAGKFTLTFIIDNKKISKEVNIKVPQGKVVKKAFQFTAPKVSSKVYGSIKLEYTNTHGKVKNDTFKLAVFPKKSRPVLNFKIAAASVSAEESILQKAGIKAEKISLTEKIPQDIELLVIEKNALTKKTSSAFLKEYIDNGGQVLIMAQNSKSLLDWRLRERRLEAVFISDRKHSVVKGLSDQDLAYFRGASTIIPREKRPSKYYRHTQSAALDTPHLTNVGIVAAYVMQKPCYGSFKPILVGGYDLEEVALIEMRSGKGRAILCQLDLTERYGLDPAATLLTDNIFEYFKGGIKNRIPAVDYIGGNKGKEFLKRIGISSTKTSSGEILVIGDNAQAKRSLTDKYKTVVILPFSDYLPGGVTDKKIKIKALDNPYYWGSSFYQFRMLKSKLPAPDRLGLNIPAVFSGLVDNDIYFFESPELKSYSAKSIKWHSKESTMAIAEKGKTDFILCSVNPYAMNYGETRRKAWRVWSMIFANLNLKCSFEMNWKTPALDISEGDWTFLTDPDGKGEKTGFQNGKFGNREPRRIVTGKIWEEAGITEVNPNLGFVEDSSYDGFGWYFRSMKFPENANINELYFEINGVRDIATYARTQQQTSLWINGRKMPEPVGVYNAHRGGRGGRLWKLPKDAVKPGQKNFIAVQVYNNGGAGGIHRKPVRFENPGQNPGMLFPYEFIKSKYTPYFFWCW